jgi:hypothetical protein
MERVWVWGREGVGWGGVTVEHGVLSAGSGRSKQLYQDVRLYKTVVQHRTEGNGEERRRKWSVVGAGLQVTVNPNRHLRDFVQMHESKQAEVDSSGLRCVFFTSTVIHFERGVSVGHSGRFGS